MLIENLGSFGTLRIKSLLLQKGNRLTHQVIFRSIESFIC